MMSREKSLTFMLLDLMSLKLFGSMLWTLTLAKLRNSIITILELLFANARKSNPSSLQQKNNNDFMLCLCTRRSKKNLCSSSNKHIIIQLH